jgi:hypothetical protein
MEEKGVVDLMSSHVGVTANDAATAIMTRLVVVVGAGFPIRSVASVRQFPGGSIKTNNKEHDLTALKVVCHVSNLFPFVFRQCSLTFINLRC